MNSRKQSQIISEIKDLVQSKGFIYALCMIIFEDNHIIVEELNMVNYHDRLNKNEISLLVGFLVQNNINFTPPNDPKIILQLKSRVYELFEELHWSMNVPLFENMKEALDGSNQQTDFPSFKELYSSNNSFTEPIFYANDGVYDFQYLDFLRAKYKYDEKWLKDNRNFEFDKTISIINKIRDIVQKRSLKTTFLSLKEKGNEIKDVARKAFKGRKAKFEEEYNEYAGALEFFQYAPLFFESGEDVSFSPEKIYEQEWNSFYENIIDLFVVRKSDFDDCDDFEAFSKNFSINPSKNTNKNFKNVGDFNEFTACPLIQIDDERFFFPITYSLYEAVYECPYYWMTNDKTYLDTLGKHRGETGEEITYEILSNVFGVDRTFRSVKIETRKGFDDTDIDILCILGSKALCVQVKSKKLTQTTKQGNYKTLLKDFQGAVQDAYNQGLVCRDKILRNNAKFYDSEGKDFQLPKGIDEVYIMGITSENFPALTHQSHVLLEKDCKSPFALFMSVFDLEVVAHYLKNPYDFLYYIRQRIALSENAVAENELLFLSYHLQRKLALDDKMSHIFVDSSLGGDIDRDYYPHKMGLKTSDNNNVVKKRWKNAGFEELCMSIALIDSPKVTDVIFSLYDWDEETRDNIVRQIANCKQKTKVDGKQHDITLVSNVFNGYRSGLTFHSFGLEDFTYQQSRLIDHCRARKYHSKSDSWIGLASFPGSDQVIDLVVFNNQQWKFDPMEEKDTRELLPKNSKYIKNKGGKKTQRNEPCPCGSNKKYKKCCGRI